MKTKGKSVISLVLLGILMFTTYSTAFAAWVSLTSYLIYNGDTHTKRHYYERGAETWNAKVRSIAPRTYSYLGGSAWQQQQLCNGVVQYGSKSRGGWANYDNSVAQSPVFWLAYVSGGCYNERVGISAMHQFQDYGWQNPVNSDFASSLPAP